MTRGKLLEDLDFLHKLLLDFDIDGVGDIQAIFDYTNHGKDGIGYSLKINKGYTKIGMSGEIKSKYIRYWNRDILKDENLIVFDREKLHNMEYIEYAMRTLNALFL